MNGELDGPHVKRFRLGRMVALLVVVLALLVLVILIKGGKDVDEPKLDDLVLETSQLAEEDNAWTYLEEAIPELRLSKEEAYLLETHRSGSAGTDDEIRGLVEQNREAINLCRRAAGCDRCVIPDTLAVWGNRFDELTLFKMLLSSQVRLAGEAGDWDAAVDASIDHLRVWELVLRDVKMMMHFIRAVGGMSMALDDVRWIAQSGSANRAQIDRLMKAVSDLRPLNDALCRVYRGDYWMVTRELDTLQDMGLSWNSMSKEIELVRGGFMLPVLRDYLFHKNRTMQHLADVFRLQIANARLPLHEIDDTAVKALADPNLEMSPGLFLRGNGFGRLVVSGCAFAMITPKQALSSVQVDQAITRMLLALHACRLDHGSFPPAVGDLLDGYLTSIPMDPWTGKPLGYSCTGQVVYSVGEDGVDSVTSGTSSPDDRVVELFGPGVDPASP